MIRNAEATSDVHRIPGLMERFRDRAKTFFGYKSAAPSHRREAPDPRLAGEDWFQRQWTRRNVLAGPRDAIRNISLLGFAIRRVIDATSCFNINFETGDPELDKDLERWLADRSRRKNFDVAQHHSRKRYFRLVEARKLLDGDMASIKLSTRNVQGIESDRIWNPPNISGQATAPPSASPSGVTVDDRWVNGVRINRFNRRVAAGIYRRSYRGGYSFYDRTVSFERLIWHQWHDTHYRLDAIRGTGPIAISLNDFVDVDEAKGHAKSKLKVAQMVSLVVKTALEQGAGEHYAEQVLANDGDDTLLQWWADMGSGPQKLEVQEGSDVQLLDPKTGATEVVTLLDWCAAMALKSMDVPIAFLDESKTNFHGSKQAMNNFDKANRARRQNAEEEQREWLDFQLETADAIGELPRPASIDLDEIKRSARFMPDGNAWLDLSREVKPTLEGIAGGIMLPSDVIGYRYGMTLGDFAEAYEREIELAEAHGIKFGGSSPPPAPADPADTPQDSEEITDDDVEGEDDGEGDA